MNYSTLSIAPIILALSLSNAHAADYATTHTISSGDIISADMMNELFDYIKKANVAVTAENLLGTYSCTSRTHFQDSGSYSSCKTFNGEEGLYITQSGTITFSADGDGTHTYTTGAVNFLRCFGTGAVSSFPFVIKNNVMFTKLEELGETEDRVDISLKRISDTRFLMNYRDPSSSSYYQHVECDKTLTPPTNPTAFAVATTNLSNVLTWTDNSSDESGFKVYKKTTVAGAWTLIDAGAGLTVSTNIVTYTDTVSAAGDNWYRVKANHVTNGDSIGSKVIKVTNSN